MGEAIWIGMGGSNGVLLSVYNYMGMGKRCLGFSARSDKLGVWEFVSFVHDRRKIKRVWAYIYMVFVWLCEWYQEKLSTMRGSL